jgi:toxin YoeB
LKLLFDPDAWRDYREWQSIGGVGLERLDRLIEECRRHPFRGTGKPEPLGGNLSGWWSRRIDREHRLVYRVSGTGSDQRLEIAQCRQHY